MREDKTGPGGVEPGWHPPEDQRSDTDRVLDEIARDEGFESNDHRDAAYENE